MKPVLLLPALALFSPACLQAATLFGPTTYQGRFDSPFYAGIQAGTIAVEDFEARQITTPGLHFTKGGIARYPGGVDEDDGRVDGQNVGAVWSNLFAIAGTSPPILQEITFDPNSSGNYPSYAGFSFLGFVRESVIGEAFFLYKFFDSTGSSLTDDWIRHDVPRAPDNTHDSSTLGGRFVGAFNESGISSIHIRFASIIDHVQFGWSVPEPSAGALGLAVLAAAVLQRRRMRARFSFAEGGGGSTGRGHDAESDETDFSDSAGGGGISARRSAGC